MTSRQLALTAFGALVLGLVLTVPMHGSEISLRTNYLTFSGPVALPGVTLGPGTYIFERAVATEPDIVVVRNTDRSKVYFLAFTERVERPAGMSHTSTVTLGEARPGTPVPITAWYPPDSRSGHRFVYR
jgi:hypothetical protein